jgi:hypothetical protein
LKQTKYVQSEDYSSQKEIQFLIDWNANKNILKNQ